MKKLLRWGLKCAPVLVSERREAVIRFFREVFRWRTVRDTGVWRYQENRATARRRVLPAGGGHQPVDRSWLEAG